MRWCWLLMAGASGCGGQADIEGVDTDDGGSPLEPPDLVGSYDSTFTEEVACADGGAPMGWSSGTLAITGQPAALVFDFGDVALDGAVDGSFTWMIADSVDLEGWVLDVSAEGLAYIDDELWVLEGDMTVDALNPGGDACTLSGLLVAREL